MSQPSLDHPRRVGSMRSREATSAGATAAPASNPFLLPQRGAKGGTSSSRALTIAPTNAMHQFTSNQHLQTAAIVSRSSSRDSRASASSPVAVVVQRGDGRSTKACPNDGNPSIATGAMHDSMLVLADDDTTRPSALPQRVVPAKLQLTKKAQSAQAAAPCAPVASPPPSVPHDPPTATPPELVDIASWIAPEDRNTRTLLMGHPAGGGTWSMPRCSCGALMALLAFCTIAAIIIPVSILGLVACDNVWEQGSLREIRRLAVQGAQLVQIGAVRPTAYAGETTALNLRITEAWCRPLYHLNTSAGASNLSFQWNNEPDLVDCRDVAGVVAPLLPWATDLTYLSNRHFDIIALRNATSGDGGDGQEPRKVADTSRGSFEAWYRRRAWKRCGEARSNDSNSNTDRLGEESPDGSAPLGWEALQAIHDADWIAPLATQILVSLPEGCRGEGGQDAGADAARQPKPGTVAGEIIFPGGFYVSVWCLPGPPPGATHPSSWVGITSVVVLPNVATATSSAAPQRRGMLRELMFPSGNTTAVLAWLHSRVQPVVANRTCSAFQHGATNTTTTTTAMPDNGDDDLLRLDDDAAGAIDAPNSGAVVRYEWCADASCVWLNASRMYRHVVAHMWDELQQQQQHPRFHDAPQTTTSSNTSFASVERVCGRRAGGHGNAKGVSVWWRSSAGGGVPGDALLSSTASACTATALGGRAQNASSNGVNVSISSGDGMGNVVVVCYEQAPIRCNIARQNQNEGIIASPSTENTANLTQLLMAAYSDHVGLLVLDAKRRRVESIWGFDHTEGTVLLPPGGYNDSSCTSVGDRRRLPPAMQQAENSTSMAFPLSAHWALLMDGGLHVVPDAGDGSVLLSTAVGSADKESTSTVYAGDRHIFQKWEPPLQEAAGKLVARVMDDYMAKFSPATTTVCFPLDGSSNSPLFSAALDDNVAWSVAHVAPSDILILALWHHHSGLEMRVFDMVLSFSQAVLAACIGVVCSVAMRRLFLPMRALTRIVKKLDRAFVDASAARARDEAMRDDEDAEASQLHRSGSDQQQRLALPAVLHLWRRILSSASSAVGFVYTTEVAEFTALFAIARWEAKTLLEKLQKEGRAMQCRLIAATNQRRLASKAAAGTTTAPQRRFSRSPASNEGDHGSGGRQFSSSVCSRGSQSPSTPGGGREPQHGGADSDDRSDDPISSQPTTPWSGPPMAALRLLAGPKACLSVQPCGPTVVMTIRFPHNRLDAVQRDIPWASLNHNKGSSGLGVSGRTSIASATSSGYPQQMTPKADRKAIGPFEYLGVVFRAAAVHKAVVERVVSHQEIVLSFGASTGLGCYTHRGGGSAPVAVDDPCGSSLASTSFSPQGRPVPVAGRGPSAGTPTAVTHSPFLRPSAFEDDVDVAMDIAGSGRNGGGDGVPPPPPLRASTRGSVSGGNNSNARYSSCSVTAALFGWSSSSVTPAEDAFNCATSVVRRIHDIFFTASPEWVEAQAVRLVPLPPLPPPQSPSPAPKTQFMTSDSRAIEAPAGSRAGQAVLPLLQITIDASTVFLGSASNAPSGKSRDDALDDANTAARQDEHFLVGDALDRVAGLQALQDHRHRHAAVVCTAPYAALLRNLPERHLLLPMDTLRTALRCGMPRTDAVTVYVVVEPVCVAVGEGATLSLENQPRASTVLLDRIRALAAREHLVPRRVGAAPVSDDVAAPRGAKPRNRSTTTTSVVTEPAPQTASPRMDVASTNMLPQLRGTPAPLGNLLVRTATGPSALTATHTLQELLWFAFDVGSSSSCWNTTTGPGSVTRGGGHSANTAEDAIAYLHHVAAANDAGRGGLASGVSPRGSSVQPPPPLPLFFYDIVRVSLPMVGNSDAAPAATLAPCPTGGALDASQSSSDASANPVEPPLASRSAASTLRGQQPVYGLGVTLSHMWDDLEQLGASFTIEC